MDRIDYIDSSATPTLIFQVLDKLSANLEDMKPLQGNNFFCTKESNAKGMTIKLRKIHSLGMACSTTDLLMNFIANIVDKKITISLEQRNFDANHVAIVATLYEENSESCKNFLAQIINEDEKISKLLDELLDEIRNKTPKLPNPRLVSFANEESFPTEITTEPVKPVKSWSFAHFFKIKK